MTIDSIIKIYEYKETKKAEIINIINVKTSDLVTCSVNEIKSLIKLGYNADSFNNCILESQKPDYNKFINIIDDYNLVTDTNKIINHIPEYDNLLNKSKDFYIIWEILFLSKVSFTNVYINNKNNKDIIESISLFNKILKDKNTEFHYKNKDNKINLYDLYFFEYNKNTLLNNEIIHLLNIIKYILTTYKENSDLILEINDTTTMPNVKLLYILSNFYKNICCHKPLYSNMFFSSKYFIFKGLDTKKYITYEKLIDTIIDIVKKSKNNIIDILPSLTSEESFISFFNYIKDINLILGNHQYIYNNKMNNYVINIKNEFGKEYHTQIEKHITNKNIWITNFFVKE